MEKKSLSELLCIGKSMLEKENVPDAGYDSRALLEYIYGISKSDYFMNPHMEVDARPYMDAIKKRAERYPLQYITGEQWFMGYRFEVKENVLIPRQDTELLVEKTADIIKNVYGGKCSVLDMCTGSGCIAVSIDKMCGDADVTAVDVSENALKTAKKNSENNEAHVKFILSNLFENIDGKYDVIVSNPPYIPTKVIEGLMPEVRDYEPMLALDGEKDGLLFYEKITEQACMHLKHGGYILYEIGCEQAQAVSDILAENSYRDIKVYKDLAGLDRVVTARFE